MDQYITDTAYRLVVEDRIRELLRYRQWWRENRWADWPQERHDLETELRALVRLARQARANARPLIEREEYRRAALAAGDHFAYAKAAPPMDPGQMYEGMD